MADLKEFDLPNFKNSTFRLDKPSSYLLSKARKNLLNGYSNLKKSTTSATIYIGKLSFNTTEEQLYELFDKCGKIERIIMGLDKVKLTPTGFCFIIFENPQGALAALKYLDKTKINGRPMEIDLDPGFEEGRQFGRGLDGSQKQHISYNNYNQNNNYNRRDGGSGGYRNNNRGGYRGGRGGYRGGDRRNFRNFRDRRGGDQHYSSAPPPRRDGTRVWRPSDDPEYLNGSAGNSNFSLPPHMSQFDQQNNYQQQGQFHYNNNNNSNYNNNYDDNYNYNRNTDNQYNNNYQQHQNQNYGNPDDLPPHLAANNNSNSDLPPHLQ